MKLPKLPTQITDTAAKLTHKPTKKKAPAAGHKSASTEAHRAEGAVQVRCYVLTVSDTRTEANDRGGALIRELLEAAGHRIEGYRIVRDEVAPISEAVQTALQGVGDVEVICITGGSGLRPRDVTPEAVCPLITKEMPGFGEVFRVLSWEEVGPATMLSRAFAGVIGRTLVFAMPGSTNAVRLAMEKLIVPELGHLVREVRPDRKTSGERKVAGDRKSPAERKTTAEAKSAAERKR